MLETFNSHFLASVTSEKTSSPIFPSHLSLDICLLSRCTPWNLCPHCLYGDLQPLRPEGPAHLSSHIKWPWCSHTFIQIIWAFIYLRPISFPGEAFCNHIRSWEWTTAQRRQLSVSKLLQAVSRRKVFIEKNLHTTNEQKPHKKASPQDFDKHFKRNMHYRVSKSYDHGWK